MEGDSTIIIQALFRIMCGTNPNKVLQNRRLATRFLQISILLNSISAITPSNIHKKANGLVGRLANKGVGLCNQDMMLSWQSLEAKKLQADCLRINENNNISPDGVACEGESLSHVVRKAMINGTLQSFQLCTDGTVMIQEIYGLNSESGWWLMGMMKIADHPKANLHNEKKRMAEHESIMSTNGQRLLMANTRPEDDKLLKETLGVHDSRMTGLELTGSVMALTHGQVFSWLVFACYCLVFTFHIF